MDKLVSRLSERTFYLEGNRIKRHPVEAELARIIYREGTFEAEFGARVKLYYWGLAPSCESGDDMVQYTLTARIYPHCYSQEPIAITTIQTPWKLPWSLNPEKRRCQWLTEWCEEAIFLGLLREDAWEGRGVLKPVLEKIAKESNFIEDALSKAKEGRKHIAPDSRTLLL